MIGCADAKILERDEKYSEFLIMILFCICNIQVIDK
jgi:hypothetical protein